MPIRRFLSLLLLPPLAAIGVWLGVAWAHGIVDAMFARDPAWKNVPLVTLGALGATFLPLIAWTMYLLVVLPGTWSLRGRHHGVARAIVARVLGISTAMSAFAGWLLYEPSVDRLIDVAWVSTLVVGLPVAIMTMVAAWLLATEPRVGE